MVSLIPLSLQLFQQNIKAKFRKTFLGYLWLLIPPAFITLGVWFAARAGVIEPGVTALPYVLYAYIGTTLWLVFAEGLDVPCRAIEGASTYLTRVMFPREVVVLVQLYESSINTAVRFVSVLVLMAVTDHLSFRGALATAGSFLLTLILACGIGAFLAPLMLLFGDFQKAFKLVLTYGLFLTPALYMPQRTGFFADIVRWNPVTPVMGFARDASTYGGIVEPGAFALMSLATLVLAALGAWFIRKAIPVLAERMLLGGH